MSQTPSTAPISPDQCASYETDLWMGWVDNSLLNPVSREWIADPKRFFDQNVIRWFKRGRNQLAEVRWPNDTAASTEPSGAPALTVVLKEYRVNGPIGLLRAMRHSSKAQRASDQAFALRQRGIRTPKPLWLALPKNQSLRAPSYLAVETAPPHDRLRELLKQLRGNKTRVEFDSGLQLDIPEFLRVLASYVRRMHDAGIWHRDFSGGNLLIPVDWRPAADGKIDPSFFILIDVNRARILPAGSLSISQRLQDLERISLPQSLRPEFYRYYAAGNPELEAAKKTYLRWAQRYRKLREARNPVERLLRRVFGYWLRMP